MNKTYLLIFTFFLINNCSFNENSRIWQKKDQSYVSEKNTKKLFVEKEIISTEFNPQLTIKISKINDNDKINNNRNNKGSQNYPGLLNKIISYKFSKLDNIKDINYRPAFLSNGLIFFDNKGSIIRYDHKKNIIWKKNHYSKAEKKLKPKLFFGVNNENLLVADNIAKYYSVNINTGKLNWSKNNTYPFNSEIKIYKNKFFVIDYKNTLRCYNIINGSECWSMQTEDSFTISNSKYSLIIVKNIVIFNNSIGDVTAVDIETGLVAWQLPTQSSSIENKTYKFKVSKLVSDGKSIFFSNNKNEFYSIDVNSGTVNWVNRINSNLTPILNENLIFSISNNGYLFVVQKNNGNIIRITDLYKNFKIKKKKDMSPVGFVIGKNNLYFTSNTNKFSVLDLEFGKIIKEIKISGKLVSEPFIFNEKLFLIKNGSIIGYN